MCLWISSGTGGSEVLSSGDYSRSALYGRPKTKHGLHYNKRPEDQCRGHHLREQHSGVGRDWKLQNIVNDVLFSLNLTHLVESFRSRLIKFSQTILNIPVADSVGSDLYSSFEKICNFIGKSG